MSRFFKLLLMVLFLFSNAFMWAKDSKSNFNVLTSFEGVAAFIKENKRLPDNFITKKEAKKKGWKPGRNLSSVLPGKSIGGDVFQNREKRLPSAKGRIWYEADIHYKKGRRGKDRLLFSNDGLFFKTEDHYQTFQRMKI